MIAIFFAGELWHPFFVNGAYSVGGGLYFFNRCWNPGTCPGHSDLDDDSRWHQSSVTHVRNEMTLAGVDKFRSQNDWPKYTRNSAKIN